MPHFKAVDCMGACERLGRCCIRPVLYAGVAEQYGATPVPVRIAEGFTTYVLAVPAEQRERAIRDLQQHFHDADVVQWLGEAPCHTDCDIAIRAVCGGQHEDSAIYGEHCLYEPERDDDDQHDR